MLLAVNVVSTDVRNLLETNFRFNTACVFIRSAFKHCGPSEIYLAIKWLNYIDIAKIEKEKHFQF